MLGVVTILGAITSLACAALLSRGFRRTGSRLLMWSAACFLALAAENLLVFIDEFVIVNVELIVFRRLVALIGLGALLYGLIWETK